MASRKRSGSSSKGKGRSRKRVRVQHIVRQNPGEEMFLVNPPPSRARRAARRVAGFVGSSGIGAAARNTIPMVAGALAAKLAQKKFGDGTSEEGNWTWKDYLVGGIGCVAASYVAKGIFKANPQTAQKVLEGGFTILAFKLVTQELVPMSDTAKAWLGEEGEGSWAGQDEGSWAGQDEGSWAGGFDVGDLYESNDGSTWVLGADGYWRPADEAHRLPAYAGEDDGTGLAGVVRAPGNLGGFGGVVRSPGRLGQDDQPFTAIV